jgi:hypothetical protein
MGRPATGRTTKMVRVPQDLKPHVATALYVDVLPILAEYYARSIEPGRAEQPRYDQLHRLFDELMATSGDIAKAIAKGE